MPEFSDYIVYVDESGDHGLVTMDPYYPVFVLAFCLFSKSDYVERICPALQRLKFRFWGHEEQVLHEHDIRKPNRNYGFLFNAEKRGQFLIAVNELIREMPFQLVAAVIRKQEFRRQYVDPVNPYGLAMEFGLERIHRELEGKGQAGKLTHVVVEKRGKKEDDDLELAFRRICDGANVHGKPLQFELTMIPKTSNSAGLQLAELLARPVGIKVLRPDQPNRAYDILEGKFRRSPPTKIEGWGLKIFP